MKTIIYTLLLILISLKTSAQRQISKEDFKALNQQQKELFASVQQYENERKNRINTYLKSHKEAKISKNLNGKLLIIHDIIDGSPVYKGLDNKGSAEATNTTDLQHGGSLNLNLDGSGISVGVWDGGPIQQSHPEFQDQNGVSRINIVESFTVDGNSDDDNHGTHVGGTIAALGLDDEAKGMASAVTIESYNYLDDVTEILPAISNSANPIILSNHSYGVQATSVGSSTWFFGAYTADARLFDEILYNYPEYTLVTSAGNAGNFNNNDALFFGLDKLTADKNAKNSLVVANANPILDPFTGDLSLQISDSSSEGPTDDLRIKPDLAAPGNNIYSTTPNGTYGFLSGTSMAAPNVTGTIALLQQYYKQLNGEYMKASTVKALLCHTALDDSNIIGPDPVFGWGLLDARFAAETITNSLNNNAIIDERTLTNNSNFSINFTVSSNTKLSATLCWTDVPGNSVSGATVLNNLSPKLVNDLDLRITKDGMTYFPWTLTFDPSLGVSNEKNDNIRDNIERIDINIPEAGNYTLSISHKGNLQTFNPFETNPTQDYSLIVTGDNLTLSDKNFDIQNIVVSPNPASDYVEVSGVHGEFTYELYDITGRVVKNQKLSNPKINLTHLEKGTYFLKLTIEGQSLTKKIIKAN
jgi:subtilisin family serine protease